MKKIALDLDGVVFDSENLYRVYTEIYDVDHFKKNSIIDNAQRIYQKRYDWSEEEQKKFYELYAHEILKNSNISTGADIVLTKLSSCYEFIVVTARQDSEIQYAKEFFDSIGLANIKIYNNQTSKIDVLINENCDYIIDDDENTCRQAAQKGITGIYFKNAAANVTNDTDYFKVVNNWGEIYKYLMLSEEK